MEVMRWSRTRKNPYQLKQCAFGDIRRRFYARFAASRLFPLGTRITKTNLDNTYGCALAPSAKRCSPRNRSSNSLKDYPSCTMEQNQIREQNFARGLDFLDLFFIKLFIRPEETQSYIRRSQNIRLFEY